jgi:hypothetical protein
MAMSPALPRCSAVLLALAGCNPLGGEPVCDGVNGVTVTRLVEHPGAGREVTVRAAFDNGVPIGEADLVRCLSARLDDGMEARVARRPLGRAYTLLLVDPGVARQTNETVRGLVEALVRRRPPDEVVALYRWGAEVTQLAPFLADRRVLFERMAAGLSGTEVMAPVSEALPVASAAVGAVGGIATDAMRTIILVAPRTTALTGLAAAVKSAAPNLVTWIGFADQGGVVAAALPSGLRFTIPAQTVPASVVASMSDRLDAYKMHAHYAIGLCGVPTERPLEILFQGAAPTSLTLPPTMEENRPGLCQPEALAAGRRRFPRRLELVFTPEQRVVADAAAADKLNKPRFELSVRVGTEAAPTPATAHYRGDGSYLCQRRSYTVNMQGKEPRFFFPDFASSKFHLVAMCLDRLYLRNFTALHLLAEEGLFPVPFDMVELAVDGVSQGPYLVLENVSDSLRVHQAGVTAVLRRDKPPSGVGTVAEVRWAAGGDDAAALASYDRILATTEGLSGQRLENALRDRFDIDGYFTWLALMNMLASADYVDELFFYAAETTTTEANRADYHMVMGWDQDDIFGTCHASGRDALYDRHGLLTCTEADLDKRLFSDSLLYSRYADLLGKLLERYSTERFAALVHATGERLLTFFKNPEALAGLVELRKLNPDATSSPEVARTLLESEMELLTIQYDQSRTELLSRLARYRANR